MQKVDGDCGKYSETNASISLIHHSLIVLAVLTVTAAMYYSVTKSYFCSYDDFIVVHRAAFMDTPDPKLIFTTTHLNSFKYRPIDRALDLLTYAIGHGGPGAFRLRNLFFHLLNAALVYFLAIVFRKPSAVAATAALIFGVHPFANQAVIGAVMTNTASSSMYLAAIILFVWATRLKSREVLYVVLAGIVGVLSLLTYDSNLVVFGVMAAYLLMLRFFLGETVSKRLVIALSTVSVCFLGLSFGVRQVVAASAYHSAAGSIVRPGLVLHNAATYAGALLQLLDPVLLNQWFGAPLPSDPNFFTGLHGAAVVALTGAVAIAICVTVLLLARSPRSSESWVFDTFLVIAGWFPVLPMLLLAGHPSETYIYLPVAFMTVVLMSLLYDLSWERFATGRLFLVCGVCVGFLFGSATLVRNHRAAACGATAQKILAAISFERLRDGATVGFFDAASDRIPRPYGYYQFDGLDTIGPDSHIMEYAVQAVSGNNKIYAHTLDLEEFRRIGSGSQPSQYDEIVVFGTDGNISNQKIPTRALP